MKKINYILIILLVALFVTSCASGTDITKKNGDGSPIWTTEIPKSTKYLYGVGKAKLLVDSNSQTAADAVARSDLALKINVNIKDALASYSNEASATVQSAYETLLVQSVNLTMKRVVVEERWTAPDGTVWSLVSIKVKELPSLYEGVANDYLNQLEEKKVDTQAKLVTLLEELGENDESDTIELRKLAQAKSDSIVNEIIEVENSIDAEALKKDLDNYLLEKGYLLVED